MGAAKRARYAWAPLLNEVAEQVGLNTVCLNPPEYPTARLINPHHFEVLVDTVYNGGFKSFHFQKQHYRGRYRIVDKADAEREMMKLIAKYARNHNHKGGSPTKENEDV